MSLNIKIKHGITNATILFPVFTKIGYFLMESRCVMHTKKKRRVICPLHKSPNLIDREKNCSSGESSPHLNGIQVEKILTEFTHTQILKGNFMVFKFPCQ
jgi:hypothetical protein